MTGVTRTGNPFRLIGVLVLVLIGPFTAASAQEGGRDAAPLDLAAMVLMSADINEADLIWRDSRDYGLYLSMSTGLEDFITYSVTDLVADEDDVREALVDAGFVRGYQAVLAPTTVRGDGEGRWVIATVTEFADVEGAEDGFTFLQNESAIDEATDIDGLDRFGDDSEATLFTGGGAALLDISVQIDRLHFDVMLLDWEGEEPDVEDAARLVEPMLDRVVDALDSPGWSLSTQVVRLTGETVSPYADAYLLRDGVSTRLTRNELDEHQLEELAEEMDLTSEYRLWQRLLPSNDDPNDNAFYYLSVMQFEDEETADAWIEERPDEIEDHASFTDVEFADADDVDVGDAAFSYTAESADTGNYFRNVTLRLGNLVLIIDLTGPDPVPEDALAALVEAQWTCLEIRNCFVPVELPDSLQEYLDDMR